MSLTTSTQAEDVDVSVSHVSFWFTPSLSWTARERQVRLVDQEKINEFGRLNNRLLEIRADIAQYKQDIEKLEDASTELAMSSGGKIMLFMGESFLETSEDHASDCKIWIFSNNICFLLYLSFHVHRISQTVRRSKR